ncbi:MAG: NAD(P)H-dependent glycerol-3-phosphate dehydrogenase [Clostridium perfringens]|nr:NAD(P)H-dependent glycerol-3-phosphate dehydrogenase [Clostridium perfringens]
MSRVTFLGGGSFGTALATLLGNKRNDVSIWDRDLKVVNDININRKNDKYIKGLDIPLNVTAYTNIDDSLKNSEYVILAVPSHIIRTLCKIIKDKIDKDVIIINIAKGIEEGSNLRLSEVIEEELPENPVVVLSGPSHAEEVAFEMPTTMVVTSNKMKYADKVQDLFMNKHLRIYTNDDIIGVEVGGAVKNIIALAAGVLDGIGYGDNAKAALMTRSMAEIARVGVIMGGKMETFFGLTGMGDLIVTCISIHSRNRKAGILIGQGKTMDEAVKDIGMVVEGIKACRAFYSIKESKNVNMPITDMAYKVLFNNKCPREAVRELMERDRKSEVI